MTGLQARHSPRYRWAGLVVLVTIPTLCTGCIWPETAQGKIVESENGSIRAFAWVDRIRVGIPGTYLLEDTLAQRLSVRWRRAGFWSPENKTHIPTETPIAGFWAPDREAELFFSPDGRHLAVVVQMDVVIIDLESAKSWGLTDRTEDMAGFRWLSNDAIGYVTRIRTDGCTRLDSGSTGSDDRYNISYRRQSISPGSAATLVKRLEKVEGPSTVGPAQLEFAWDSQADRTQVRPNHEVSRE